MVVSEFDEANALVVSWMTRVARFCESILRATEATGGSSHWRGD